MALPSGKALRVAFGESVTEIAKRDPRIVMLDGDVGISTRADIFEAAYPDRFFQMGIAEQNMLALPRASQALDSFRLSVCSPVLPSPARSTRSVS